MHYRTVVIRTVVAVVVAATVPSAWSQTSRYVLPETLWVDVIYYDFHCDGSNPNFEAGSKGRKPGMVQDTLGPDLKPVFKEDLCYNSRLNEWFRPSGSDGSVQFVFDPVEKRWEWTGLVPSVIDPRGWQGPLWRDRPADSMANMVFYDSLPFLLVDSVRGTYEFVRDNNLNHQQFFGLDSMGFGNEVPKFDHNYSFSMELHSVSVYQGGEVLEFHGDDDFWAYVNGKLVADLGGTQSEGSVTVDLDALADSLGLAVGQQYALDCFYTERLAFQSNCVITTNMLTPIRTSNLVVTTRSTPPAPGAPSISDTTLLPGQTIPLYAYVFDNTGAVTPEYADRVVWEFFDASGVKFRADTVADHISFTFPNVNGCVTIRQTFVDSLRANTALVTAVTICNRSGAAAPAAAVAVQVALLDTNANGQFDRIDIVFPDTVSLKQNLPSLGDIIDQASIVSSTGERIQLQPVAVVRYDSTTLHVILKEASGTTPQTGWQSADVGLTDVPLTTMGNPATVSSVVDAAGPVVQKSTLLPGSSPGVPDTLKVFFSEPVDCRKLTTGVPQSVFVYSDSGTLSAEALQGATFAGGCPTVYVTSAMIVVNNDDFHVSVFEDSIRFAGNSSSVVDQAGNQAPPNARKAVIKPSKVTPIECTPFPNPAPIDREIDSRIRQAYAGVLGTATHGMVIGVYSEVPLKQTSVKGTVAYGRAAIYDATANLVRADLPVLAAGTPGVYGIYWDGRNRNGRMVGNGTYLITVATTDLSGKTSHARVKAGVRR